MYKKNILVLVCVFCSVFHYTVSTGKFFNALKNSVQNARCKLHNIGSQIVQHEHNHGDPCAQQGIDNQFGSQNGNDNSYGNANYNGNPGNIFGHNNQGNQFGHGNHGSHFGQFQQVPYRQCTKSYHCLLTEMCYQYRCVDPCLQFSCSENSVCQVVDHFPLCYKKDDNNSEPPINNGVESSTISYQATTSTKKNEILKNNSDGSSNFEQGNTNVNSGSNSNVEPNGNESSNTINKNIEDIFGKPNINNETIDNSLQDINSTSITSTSNPFDRNPLEKEKLEQVVHDIFAPLNTSNSVDNNNGDQDSGPIRVTTENYPSTLDIDIRLSAVFEERKASTKVYADVPRGGGKNIIKVKCPDGTIPTNDGQCLEEL